MNETVTEATPRGFKRFQKRAEQSVEVPTHVQSIAQRAAEKLGKHKGRLHELRRDVPLLLRLTRAWARKDYTEIPWKSIVSVVAALLYFISPLDVIPDFIPFIGFVDDAAVVAFVLKSLRTDLSDFQCWEAEQASTDSSQAVEEQTA